MYVYSFMQQYFFKYAEVMTYDFLTYFVHILGLALTKEQQPTTINFCTLLKAELKLILQEIEQGIYYSKLYFLSVHVFQWDKADMTIFAAFANADQRMMFFSLPSL